MRKYITKASERIGVESTSRDGKRAQVVSYSTCENFIIRFCDGKEMKLKNWRYFIEGNFNYEKHFKAPRNREERIGEKKIMNNGLTAEVIEYRGSQIMNRFDDTKVSIFTADFEVLTKLTGFKLTRGMLCAMRRKPLRKFQDLCDGINRIAILENVQNPTNVGAIFRSAAALNMEAVLLSPGCSDPLYRRASRVSMGTVFQIPWTFIRDSNEMRCKREVIWPKQAIAELKKLGYKTAALALTDDSVSIDDSELMKEEKLAVILGNEGEGLENETIALCDYTVKIPMTHGVDSLNVAAASAVAFWQLGKIIL